MSREILFRIKDGNNKWIYGFPLVYDDGGISFIDQEPLNELKPTELCEINYTYSETLGQYTGLNDKNGNKIFEGDILGFKFNGISKAVALVEFSKKYTGFRLKPLSNFSFALMSDGIIIGNIHDNPEFLMGD